MDGRCVMGGPALLKARSVDVPEALADRHGPGGRRGQAAIFLAEDSADGRGVEALAVFIVADVVRPESQGRRAGAARPAHQGRHADR